MSHFPRSHDRGSIEATNVLRDLQPIPPFRDHMIAAPLKPGKSEAGQFLFAAFRDHMIAAPLKRDFER